MKEVNAPRKFTSIGIIENLELIDSLYGITKEEREVLDVIRGFKDLKIEGEELQD